MNKLALGIEYNGTAYCGWQRQKTANSIQERLECALSFVANESVSAYCAGRTDAGVHATGQVVHFITNAQRSNANWIMGVNSQLPSDIVVRWVTPVKDDFHVRFSALSRRYRYIIYNNSIRPVFFKDGLVHFYRSLDIKKMLRAGQCLLGENNFTSFQSLQCQSNSPWRNVYYFGIVKCGYCIVIDIKANAFVYHMVRNIVGSLLEIGCGKRSENWIAELLELRNRTLTECITAPAKGLYLIEVKYPSRFDIPNVLHNSLIL